MSSAGSAAISINPATEIAASAPTAAGAPNAAATAPAIAGPAISATLKLSPSSAFADGSRSSGTSTGIMLVKPPNASGWVTPGSSAIRGRIQAGECPARSRMASRAPTRRTWSSSMIARRLPLRSSQAPSSGPDTRLGKVTAATVAPAVAALPVRPSTSSTTATENISMPTRTSVAVQKKAT